MYEFAYFLYKNIVKVPERKTNMSQSFVYVKHYLANRLGDEFSFNFEEQTNPYIRLDDTAKSIIFPPFLAGLDVPEFFEEQSLELQMISVGDFVQEVLGEKEIPIFSRQEDPLPDPLVEFGEDVVRINFDILGSIFYILTRAEEFANPTRDEHGRFPAWASHAFQNGYLHRPVVDEYIEILWACMKRLWPRLERKKREFRMILSHDVDVPFAEAFMPPYRISRTVAGDFLKRKDPLLGLRRMHRWSRIQRGYYKCDPNYSFDRLMDISEKYGLQSAFYFKTACTNPEFDSNYSIDHPFLRNLIQDISNRGHEIGVHPSYETYKDSVQTKKEFDKLLQVCEEEGIRQDAWGGRQHYLRWEAPATWRNWAEAGLNYDSTLSYADCAGFRCGTCHEFPVFDLEQGKELSLIERPLIVMEGSLFGKDYMNLSHEEAFAHAKMLKEQCRKYGGNFTLLWHNSSFKSEKDWKIFEDILFK